MLARLALRNLWRNPRRTVLTIVSIIAGVAISILGRGFIEGLTGGIIAAAVDGTVGHVMARPAGYPTQGFQRPVDELLEVNAAARALLDGEARAWTTRTQFAPLLAKGGDSLRVAAIGYDPSRDPSVFPRDQWKVQGVLPTGKDIAVSGRIAELLDVKLGDTVVLQVRTHRGAMNALEARVAGIVRTGNPALDLLGIWVPQPLTRELIASELPSHLSAKLSSPGDSEAFARKLGAALGAQSEVVTWQSETAELVQLQEVRRKALNLVVFILLALAAFGIANTVLMAAHERVREIGTLRSMGMTEGGVLGLFLVEGALMGVVGGLIGAGLGGGLVLWWAAHPIDFSKTMEETASGLAAPSLIYTHFEFPVLVVAMLLGTVVAVIASIYPARVAAQMIPADAVRASS